MQQSLNPILSNLGNNQPQATPQLNQAWMQQVKGLMNGVKMAQNPQLMLNQLMMNNPQLKAAMALIQQGGGNSQQTFYALAKQMGVNPDDVLNALK